jgi:putative tryptophan/tyrosine transport system substrate-binding protein
LAASRVGAAGRGASRWANSKPGGLRDSAADLARRTVAVIATPGSIRAALAAKAATTMIPIAFSMGQDPVQVGLLASLARPRGNITGFTELNPDVLPKWLALLCALVPQAAGFGLPVNPRNRVEGMIGEAQMAAASLRRPIDIFTATATNEIDTSFVSGLLGSRVSARRRANEATVRALWTACAKSESTPAVSSRAKNQPICR